MATRERKAKLSAESPTPSAGNESTPTTPTNASAGGGKGGRKVSSGTSVGTTTGRVRSTRGANAQQVAEEGELEKEKEKTEENSEVVSEPVAVKTPRTPRASRATTTVAQKAAEAKAAEAKAAEARAAEAKAAEAKAAEAKLAEAKAAEAKAAEAKAAEAKTTDAKVEETKEDSGEKGEEAADEVENNEEAADDAADEESQKNTSSSPRTLRKSATPTAKGSGGKRRRRVRRDGVVRPRAIMKRKTMPAIPSRSASAAAMVTRRNSIAKIEAIAKAIKEETVAVRKSTRTRRKTKIADEEPIKRKRKRMMSEQEKIEEPPKDDAEMKQPEKVTKSEVLSDTELIRRRSDSVSKYSDTTDNSSFYDAATFKGGPEEWGRDSNATPKVDAENEEVKVENVEMEEESTAAEAKPAVVKEETKVEETEAVPVQKKRQTILVRRSRRARKSTQKEREVEAAAAVAKTAKVAENKTDGSESVMNSVGDTDVNSAKGAPLHVETVVKESTAVEDVAKEGNEEVDVKKTKASSLSPELVSEGVSPISVQQFYGQPAFLENNLGIEEDPKLREIVQVKEKIKQVESTETQEDEKEEMKVEEEKVEKVEEKEEDSEMKEIVNGTTEDEIQDDLKIEEETKPEEKEIVMDTEEKKEEGVEEEVPKVEEVEEENKNTEDITESIAENLDSNEATEDQNKTNDKENVVSNGEAPQQMEKDDKLTMADDTSKSPLLESPETRLKKECHLKSLGLLTHEAAVEAKIEKARRREFFKSTANNSSLSSASSTSSGSSVTSQQSNGTRNGKSGRGHGGGQEYTGTLKTVIKLHRPQSQEKRKTRMPLKMTFQKGRVKSANSGNDKDQVNLSNSDDDTYYTIQNETDGPNADTVHGGISRKTHYRSHTGDSAANTSVSAEPSKEVQKALVIPEKASSFSIHPGRLCQDQCFYCGGKFGLFDTPCHVAQIKSLERQKKILDNEEKLTVDNCLCDACYRHVDRRANCPSYRNKRQSAALASSDYNKEETAADSIQHEPEEVRSSALCLVTGCGEASSHLLRRKWFSKMRKPINKLIRLNVDVSNAHGLGQVPICHKHYDIISHLMVCVLCKRKLPRNHIFYINQEIKRLEQLIRKQGIPVILGTNAVVCKLCRYYTNLLLKPPDRKTQRAQFVRSYRRRLLSFHNVEMLDASDDKEGDQRTTQPTKRRGRKSPDEEQENDQELSDQNDSSQNASGQILLDNDVMVDYDVPVLDGGAFAVGQKGKQQQQQKMQSLLLPRNQQLREKQQRLQAMQKENEISRMLRTNPNISMRELFPGEDEMGLQVYLPFGQGGHRTPEGWTRATSILQYDDATKLLWEELQKPYGNQSSFIRHLVLLEKYFRNGDLILSPAASSNAVTYSESVQNRLKSFDNVTSDSLSIFHQLSNAPITITPANPKGRTSSGARYSDGASGSSTSLLKSNNTRKEDGFGSPDKGYNKSQEGSGGGGGVSIIKKSTTGGIPPDLISITTTPSNKSSAAGIDTITVTATGGQKGTSPPAAGATPSPPPNTVPPHVNTKDVIVKLPESLSPAERRLVNGKAWRPTLMPIAPLERDSSRDGVNTLYQTADGRLLPSRVQVMSGGKPYHISIYDYNRMCILRREKILQKAMAAQQGKPENGQKAGGGGGGERSPPSQQPTASTSKGKVSIPNKILEQNSVLPIGTKASGTSSELQSLIKVRKPNPTSLLKNQIPIAPKPPVQQQPPAISAIVSLSTTTTMPNANPMMSIIDLMKTTTSSPAATTSMWLLNEPLNGPAAGAGAIVTDTSAASLLSKIPKSLTVIPQQKGSRSGSRVSSGEDQSSA